MHKEVFQRIQGLENIVHDVKNNQELLEYISISLHKGPINLFNNMGLLCIWKSVMSVQLIDYYKAIKDDEKFSFQKCLNVMKNNKIKIDFISLEKKLYALKKKYDSYNYEHIRSKYIAHQDLNGLEINTDILEMKKLSQLIISLFKKISKEIGYKQIPFSKESLNSFKKIFDTIHEYEQAKAFIFINEIQGLKSISIKELNKVIKK
jgi:hypothetical protein